MCELLAMAARWPAAVSPSLEELSRHGGFSGPRGGCEVTRESPRPPDAVGKASGRG